MSSERDALLAFSHGFDIVANGLYDRSGYNIGFRNLSRRLNLPPLKNLLEAIEAAGIPVWVCGACATPYHIIADTGPSQRNRFIPEERNDVIALIARDFSRHERQRHHDGIIRSAASRDDELHCHVLVNVCLTLVKKAGRIFVANCKTYSQAGDHAAELLNNYRRLRYIDNGLIPCSFSFLFLANAMELL